MAHVKTDNDMYDIQVFGGIIGSAVKEATAEAEARRASETLEGFSVYVMAPDGETPLAEFVNGVRIIRPEENVAEVQA